MGRRWLLATCAVGALVALACSGGGKVAVTPAPPTTTTTMAATATAPAPTPTATPAPRVIRGCTQALEAASCTSYHADELSAFKATGLLTSGCTIQPQPVCVKQYLGRSDMAGLDLSGGDFRGASFVDANLKNANLSNADLTAADLRGADLAGANLAGAKLARVRLGPGLRTYPVPTRPNNLKYAYTSFSDATGLADDQLARALGVERVEDVAEALALLRVPLADLAAIHAKLAPACTGAKVEGLGAAPGSGFRPYLVVEPGTTRPSELNLGAPMAVHYAGYVVCVAGAATWKDTGEKCGPYSGGRGSVPVRLQELRLRVVDPRSGATVVPETTVVAPDRQRQSADYCPTIVYSSEAGVDRLVDVASWLIGQQLHAVTLFTCASVNSTVSGYRGGFVVKRGATFEESLRRCSEGEKDR